MKNSGQPTTPRAWAALVLSQPDLESRRKVLSRVPSDWQELVQSHVRIAWERKNES